MFHIFSSYYLNTEKELCRELAKELKRRYPRKLVYEQIDIKIPWERFERMINAFESYKYRAIQYYGPELRKEIRKIVRITTNRISRS